MTNQIKIASLLFAVVCFLCPRASFAQAPKSFSADSSKFLSEMDDYFSSVKGKEKEGHDFIKEQFKPFWFGGFLTNEKRQFVCQTSIAMLQKKLRPYPDYYNFFLAMINFYHVAKLEESIPHHRCFSRSCDRGTDRHQVAG